MVDNGEDEILRARRRLHTTIYCQCFSPCGKYLAVGNNFGKIIIFSLANALSPEAKAHAWKPVNTFTAHTGAIYALTTTDRLLLSGGTSGEIHLWNWADVFTKNPKKISSLNIPVEDRFASVETNCLVVDKQESGTRLFACCGDNKVYLWDLESGSHLLGLKGHTDYVHAVAMFSSGQECVSASEDGTVRIWDIRQPQEATQIVEPYKNEWGSETSAISTVTGSEKCARPELGRWIGCVAIDTADDWMVCGGGPTLCLWHLRSLAATAVFDTPGICQKTVLFHDDSIISAGNKPFVHHWSVNGEERSKVPCSPTSVFSLRVNNTSENAKVLSIAGNSHKVDVCTNFGYRAFSLDTC